ncbi:hypothetical protein KFE25_004509 [Diacronema lutheri]|uniref:Uncharacterized protein n=1 Tax=Diacronema lutheri TaxID=2081491 RepID=A0A8J5X7P1_DIALT|nr:hypothetical protein KFE25_004499 [Diacronema lutheri]KAG8460261.1 hypothetical protein KFE25_004509 [Diacronema lutheri]
MVFVLLPAALQSSLSALRNPRTLGKLLSFRVGVFVTSAAVAAATYEAAQPTVSALQPAQSAVDKPKQMVKRRSSMLEPENTHALKSRRSHVNQLPPGVAAYWDCAQINHSAK